MNNESAISVRTDSEDRLVEIGVVGRAHGIAGALNIFLHNPDSTILGTLDRVYLKDGRGIRQAAIREFREAAKKRIIVFEGIADRTAADQIKGAKLLVDRSVLPPLSDDEFYVADLIGAEAWDGDIRLGTVTASRAQADIEMITVTAEDRSLEVPLVEDFVTSVDCEHGRINLKDTALLPAQPIKKARQKQ